jgi:Subtilisin inhibitor-like
MRALVAIVAVAIAAAVGVAGVAAAGSAKPTSLTITFWPDEQQPSEFERWTLRCAPAGGTLPNRKRACVKLASLRVEAFAQVPPEALCGLIYGGPQKAVVKGTLAGERVWSSFRRRNSCEISRWKRFSPWLLPPPEATR